MHAAGQFGHARIEVDGIFLPAFVGQLQHFADLVDQEAIGFATQVDADSFGGAFSRAAAAQGLQRAERLWKISPYR